MIFLCLMLALVFKGLGCFSSDETMTCTLQPAIYTLQDWRPNSQEPPI